MLHGELIRTKSALNTANTQLLLKETLASIAIAAQAAAEASLQLADRRSVMLREHIEELMKQVEEDAYSKKERSVRSIRKLRHVCWPWQALKFPLASRAGGGAVASWIGNRNRKMMPDMEDCCMPFDGSFPYIEPICWVHDEVPSDIGSNLIRGGALCIGFLKRSHQHKEITREQAAKDLEELERHREELESLLIAERA